MKTMKLTLAVLVATGLAAAPFAAEAKSHKKHQSSTSSQTTTGANMKSSGSSMGSPPVRATPAGGPTKGAAWRRPALRSERDRICA